VGLVSQTKWGANEAPRYYHLIRQQDLLGGWSLLREWGQTGGRATLKREFFEQRDRAESAMMEMRDQQLRKGFQVMFCQGIEAPAGSQYEP